MEDGVEAGEFWVRIGSITALIFVYGGANNRFPEWLEGNATIDSHVSK